MFLSKSTAKDLLDAVVADCGMFSAPPRAVYRDELNRTLARLCREVIREEKRYSVSSAGSISIAAVPSQTNPMGEEDVVALFEGGVAYRYLPPSLYAQLDSGAGTYTVENAAVSFRASEGTHAMTLCYYGKTQPITQNNEASVFLPVPESYLPMLYAKLMGEGYKRVGEDALAAKWLGDYNTYLESFCRLAAECRVKG